MARNTGIILLEGLPGTGKSTNAHFLFMQQERNHKACKWIHEAAHPHPVVFFDEANLTYDEYDQLLKGFPAAAPLLNRIAEFRKNTIGIDLLDIEWNHKEAIGAEVLAALRRFDVWSFPPDKYISTALEKWASFADKAAEGGTDVYILDSGIFQYQIFRLMLQNAPLELLKRFVAALVNIIRPLDPGLIYLHRENTEDTIDYLEALRGTQSLEGIARRDQDQPYYKDKPKNAETFKQFLRDYADAAQKLFDAADCRKTAIKVTDQDWASREDQMLSFLDLERKPSPNASPPRGTFQNEALGLKFAVDGLIMADPTGKERRLTPKSANEFYVECLPAVLRFDGPDQVTITGGQICERWTILGTRYIKT